MPNPHQPKLPPLLYRKIYKTGQTRGADDDMIYQNRVSRASTVLIPYNIWDQASAPPDGEVKFENGFIALVSPETYFENKNITKELNSKNLSLGENSLVFYQTRSEWEKYDPEMLGWSIANRRKAPLGGEYVARIAATTAESGEKISRGFNTTGMKGAGIRLFEYASKGTIKKCRIQLEALYWLCHDSIDAATKFGMPIDEAELRKNSCFRKAREQNLLEAKRLEQARMTNKDGQTICPLCLELLSGYGFFTRMVQAMGREVPDLTVTEINLFHIEELKYGQFNHCPYNLGWGHHHCNVVVKDSGIHETLEWMNKVVQINVSSGYFK